MTEERRVPIQVPVLARVEGEGTLELRVRGGAIEEVRLRIFEPRTWWRASAAFVRWRIR